MMEALSYGIGTLIALAIFVSLAFLFIADITQKKHGVLRNYPVVGHLRYFFEQLGEYFRQYFFSGDREEMPFNRATRAWVYRLAKNEGGTIGFGSTYDLHQPGALIFVNHPFPVLDEERLPTPALALGEGHCKEPFVGRSIVNVSGSNRFDGNISLSRFAATIAAEAASELTLGGTIDLNAADLIVDGAGQIIVDGEITGAAGALSYADPDQSKFSKCRERYAMSWDRLANLTGTICEGVRWVDNGDQTVTDNLTGLVWEQKTLAAGVTSDANGLPSEAWDVDVDSGCVNCHTKTETFARAVRGGLF